MRKVVLTVVFMIGLSLGNLFTGHSGAMTKPKPASLDTSIGGEPSSHPVPRTLPTQEAPLDPEPASTCDGRVVFVYVYPSQP